jgi:hypothetical protein
MHATAGRSTRSFLFALLGAAMLASCLMGAPQALASNPEARAQRAEEREARRQQRHAEREARHAEREARREERAARHSHRSADGMSPDGSNSQRGCKVTLSAGATQVLAGETVTLTGELKCPSAASASSQTLTVYERHGHAALDSAAAESTVTAEDGSFTFTSGELLSNTVFQVRDGRHRARVAVKVAPAVTLSVASAPQASQAAARPHGRTRTQATFSGTVSPAAAGSLVALQVAYAASGERWHSVAWSHLADDGTFTIAHGFKTAGALSVRAIVHMKGNVTGVSDALTYTPPTTQNPLLSIEASADPVAYGTGVTISGVAAAHEAAVKLIARTRGGAAATVAEATTDAAGAYSFEVTPLEDTEYVVEGSGERSAPLFEAVAFAIAPDPAPASGKAGEAITLTGAVAPASPGRVAYLERASRHGIGFRVIGSAPLDAESHYAISHVPVRAGTETLRVSIRRDGRHEAASTAPFTLAVTG